MSASRFEFGENWRSFSATVGAAAIAEAERGLIKLFPGGEIGGSRFLDIGSGSGLSSLAACRLGAAVVDAIDVDEYLVEATEALLSKYAGRSNWSVRCEDILSPRLERLGRYNIVYSWGVLHHTGAMWRALANAASMVATKGLLAVALYRRTAICPIWRLEKRFYAGSGHAIQKMVRGCYTALYSAGLLATGRSPGRYVTSYKLNRGMDWHHDVHDWLGGYPYESTDPAEVIAHLTALGFTANRVFERPAALWGLLGTHCDEYVATRIA